jgi:hypothetical protein
VTHAWHPPDTNTLFAALVLHLTLLTADGWWSAVRHIGYVFGLTPNEDVFDSFGLPYPDLSVTISQIQMEPAANMWEHFNTPGGCVGVWRGQTVEVEGFRLWGFELWLKGRQPVAAWDV